MSMGGYNNRILRVDLSNATFSEEELSPELIHDYVGGRGFGVKLLYDDLAAGVAPLGPENEIIFIAGPLAGTGAQSFARWKVFFKSPLTGTIFKSSGGGHFAAELKYAGFDGIIVKGIAETPVYLWIKDGKYELRNANHLWGLGCTDTHQLIREELNDPRVRIACIGPAGERGVRISGIFSDRRAAARGGGGAVMGMKNLKAITVRGTTERRIQSADPGAFQEAVREQVEAFRNHPSFDSRRRVGTRHTEFVALLGMYPTHNFQDGELPGWQEIDEPEFTRLTVRHLACHGCMLRCGAITKADGKYAGAWTEGPEYETIWSFSGPIGVADSGLIIAADNMCDNFGLDTISVGSTIGFAYELYERGIITRQDTGGMELIYGKDDHVLELIKQIAYRQGFGAVIADGTREAASRIGKGASQYAMQVKGLEIPAYDPRGAKAQGLNLLTSNIGADHCTGYSSQEIFGLSVPFRVDRFATEGKGTLTKWNQDKQAMVETGILCIFAANIMTPEMYSKLISTVTGIKDFADPAYLWKVAERIFNLERMFNVRDGFDKEDDVFPTRITEEKMASGPSKDQLFEAEPLLADYYKVRGWDTDGIPTKDKLTELGLGFTQDIKSK